MCSYLRVEHLPGSHLPGSSSGHLLAKREESTVLSEDVSGKKITVMNKIFHIKAFLLFFWSALLVTLEEVYPHYSTACPDWSFPSVLARTGSD